MSPNFPLVRRVFESCASLLAPDVCAGCDERIGILRIFCSACAGTLLPAEDPGEDDFAAFAYGGALASAITSFKYGGRVDRARPLAHLLLGALAPLREAPPSIVVPVPLYRARLAIRGYNQAALLAAPVARSLRARFAPGTLVRLRDTPAQASFGRIERLRNVQRAFVVAPGSRPVAGQFVLLIDDVRTTGATLAACAIALKDAGAARVATLVLAVSET